MFKVLHNEEDSTDECFGDYGDVIIIDFQGYSCPDDVDAFGGSTFISALLNDSSDQTFTPFITGQNWLITLGDGEVSQGLELAARFLAVGKKSLVKCHSKYAYGSEGRFEGRGVMERKFSVKPNANVFYKLNVIRIECKGTINNSLMLKICKQKKLIGNDHFQHDWVREDGGNGKVKALKLYCAASDKLALLLKDEVSREVIEEATSLLVDCFNNVSSVYLRSKQYGLAKEAATKAIEINPNRTKSLYLAAKAAMLDPAGLFEESDLALCKAEAIDGGDNKELKKLRLELQRAKKKNKKREKAIYNKMFAGSASKAIPSKNDDIIQREIKSTGSTSDSKGPSDFSNQFLSQKYLLGSFAAISIMFTLIFLFVRNSERSHLEF